MMEEMVQICRERFPELYASLADAVHQGLSKQQIMAYVCQMTPAGVTRSMIDYTLDAISSPAPQ